MVNKRKSYSSLLNRPGYHSTAAIAVEISANYDSWQPIDGSVYISDCGKQITLDLGACDEKAVDNALYKLDTMIKVLVKTRNTYQKMAGKALDNAGK